MGERIAVLGAGGTGHAIAADLTLAGFEINLYEEPMFKENIEVYLKTHGSTSSANVHGQGEGARHGISEATPNPTKGESE